MKKIFSLRLIVRLKNRLLKAIDGLKKPGPKLASRNTDQPDGHQHAAPLRALWKNFTEKLLVRQRRRSDDLTTKADNRFIAGRYSDLAGSLNYRLFVPSTCHDGMPLLVMLHGCSQDPEIFATGTRMNLHAEQLGFLVLYPAQSRLANPNRCWNWFQPLNQYRNMGEPALIAGMTKRIIAEYNIDSHKVYIAGLSAGAAMAYIVGSVYADIYAAIGVHSGLLYRGITNLFSAMAAMKSGTDQSAKPDDATTDLQDEITSRDTQPLIVFHGDQDKVVNAQNALDLIAYHHQKKSVREHHENDSSPPYSHTRRTFKNERGENLGEQWMIHGAGHAWSGGSIEGSYTDANGPDASREMIRFFLEST